MTIEVLQCELKMWLGKKNDYLKDGAERNERAWEMKIALQHLFLLRNSEELSYLEG